MDIASVSEIKNELKIRSNQELMESCLRLAKYKKDNKELLKEFRKCGVELRFYPMKNFALEIKDSEESVIVLRNPELKDRMVLHMLNPDLAKAHREYFYTVWKKAKPLKL